MLCIISGGTRSLSIPSSTALAAEEGQKYGMGLSMGIFSMAMSAGIGVGPLIGGWVTDTLSVRFAFWVAAMIEGIGLLLFIRFTRPYKFF
jgi:predicted MFS family arabinose efflux permease